jgi:hypothetical protein
MNPQATLYEKILPEIQGSFFRKEWRAFTFGTPIDRRGPAVDGNFDLLEVAGMTFGFRKSLQPPCPVNVVDFGKAEVFCTMLNNLPNLPMSLNWSIWTTCSEGQNPAPRCFAWATSATTI